MNPTPEEQNRQIAGFGSPTGGRGVTPLKLSPDLLAEQAGSMEAAKAIDAMRAAATQAERLVIFDDCVQGLAASTGARAALTGFSCVVVSWLDLAMGK